MSYKFKGIITNIGEVETIGSRGFKKRRIAVVDNPTNKYPNEVAFFLTGDKMGQGDSFKTGDPVEVEFYINGRKWHNTKNDKDMWFVELVIKSIASAGDSPTAEEVEQDFTDTGADGGDELPF